MPGNYYCATNNTANTLINCPVYQAFTLKVETGNGTDYPKQIFREYTSQKIVVRTFNQYDNTWTDGVSYVRNIDLAGLGFPVAVQATDLHSINKSCIFRYLAGAANAPSSSSGGVGICIYADSNWIVLIVIPYSTTKIYIAEKRATWSEWAGPK